MKNVSVALASVLISSQAMALSYQCKPTMPRRELMRMAFMITAQNGGYLYKGDMHGNGEFAESGMMMPETSGDKSGFDSFKGMVGANQTMMMNPEMMTSDMMMEKSIMLSQEVQKGMMSGSAIMYGIPFSCKMVMFE